jgi:hypothetical protein
MNIIVAIQRIMLGLIFLESGINGFVRFHSPSFGTPIAREYMAVMQATPYGHVLFGGNRHRPKGSRDQPFRGRSKGPLRLAGHVCRHGLASFQFADAAAGELASRRSRTHPRS